MLRILIADDEEIIRNGLKNLIESSGLEVTVAALAENGEQALEAVEKYSPEIILMDINMPFLGGLSAIEKIREIDKECKIIIISGYGEFEYAQKALDLGVFSYLLKPIDYRNFKNILANAIDSYCNRIWEMNQIKDDSNATESCKDIALSALNYVRDHFTDSTISLNKVAETFHISQSYLTKIFKQKTGYTFTDYLNNLRILTAANLITQEEKSYTMSQISEMVGYSSPHYFSRAFKNYIGVSPNKYRTTNLNKN